MGTLMVKGRELGRSSRAKAQSTQVHYSSRVGHLFVLGWGWGALRGEEMDSGLLGIQAESQFSIFPCMPPPLAAKPSRFLPSVPGVSGEPLSFLVC